MGGGGGGVVVGEGERICNSETTAFKKSYFIRSTRIRNAVVARTEKEN